MSFVHIKWEKGGKKRKKKNGGRGAEKETKMGERKASRKVSMKAQETKTLYYILLPKKSGL